MAAAEPTGQVPLVGVVVSEHCATHNFGTLSEADGNKLEIFDRPERVEPLLRYLEEVTGVERGQNQAVLQSQRRATDTELTRMGVTSARYLEMVKQCSRKLANKHADVRQKTKERDREEIDRGTAAGQVWEFLDKDETTLATAATEAANNKVN